MPQTYNQVQHEIEQQIAADELLISRINEHITLRRTLIDRRKRVEVKREEFEVDDWNEKAAVWRGEKDNLSTQVRSISLAKVRSMIRKARSVSGAIEPQRQEQLLELAYGSNKRLTHAINRLRPLGLKDLTY